MRADPGLVGRELELEAGRRFVFGEEPGIAALVLEGPAGIGKTSVWAAILDEALRAGLQVLETRPAPEESMLEFVGAADLLEEVPPEVIEGLPAPQRRALSSAILLLGDGPPIEVRAVHRAVLSALRALAARRGVIIGIDDFQWLDSGTMASLAFAARRLKGADVRFLLTKRTSLAGEGQAAPRFVVPSRRVRMEGLSFGAIGRVVYDHLGLVLPRAVARHLYETSGGNPLFALELGRAIAERGLIRGSITEMPLPDRLEVLVADRVSALDPTVRRALLAVALSPDPRLGELSAVVGHEGIDAAVDEAVLMVDGARVRPAHPLIGEVAKARSRPQERRDLHLRLAEVSDEEERRAMHLSLATLGEDGKVAALVASAAQRASRRGAAATAADLGERALRLTPPSDPAYLERMLDAAAFDHAAGFLDQVTGVLGEELDRFPAGQMRARAELLLAVSGPYTASECYTRYDRALQDAGSGTPLRAEVLSHMAFNLAAAQVRNLELAEAHAAEAWEIASRAGALSHKKHALAALMWARSVRGLPIHELGGLYRAIDQAQRMYESGERIEAIALMWRGEVLPAREKFESLLTLAEERGEEEGRFALRVQTCELALRVGRWEELAATLEQWARERHEPHGSSAALARFRAWLAIGRGHAQEARMLAQEAIVAAEKAGARWHHLESVRARGAAELLAGDFGTACASLTAVRDATRREGVENPGAFPVAPDLIQALALAGRHEEARSVLGWLANKAHEQDHPWSGAAAQASEGHLLLAARDEASAVPHFAEAVDRFGATGLQFDRARTLLGLGVAQRRLRRRRDARLTLEQAALAFGELGAHGWAERARAELAQIGGRGAPSASLTPTEQRVADLVAQGQSNKEVAAALFVSGGTVEAHLTRIYAKLGLRSRTELARTMARK